MNSRILTPVVAVVVLAIGIGAYYSANTLTPSPAGKGTLEGQVSIGPICPVERPDNPCKPSPEAYAARKMIVSKGGAKVATVDIDSNGHYSVQLDAGTYTIDINRIGIDRSPELPKQIQIKTGETIKLDISIDTGIRT